MHRILLLTPLLALGACDAFDDDDEGLNPFGDSWDLTVRGTGFDAFDGLRVAIVAVYNPGEDDIEARGGDTIVNGEFVISFDEELEDGEDYQIHWWIDYDGNDVCTSDEASRVDLVADGNVFLTITPDDIDLQGACSLIEGDFFE